LGNRYGNERAFALIAAAVEKTDARSSARDHDASDLDEISTRNGRVVFLVTVSRLMRHRTNFLLSVTDTTHPIGFAFALVYGRLVIGRMGFTPSAIGTMTSNANRCRSLIVTGSTLANSKAGFTAVQKVAAAVEIG
jgi:hypothetical protein